MEIIIKKSKKDPLKKPENRHHWGDTLQPYKQPSKVSGKITENDKFYKVYGGQQAKEFIGDPEKKRWYEKKFPKGIKK